MYRHNIGGLVSLCVSSVGITVCLSPTASADAVASWNGEYTTTFRNAQKDGTSMAADQQQGRTPTPRPT